MVFNLVNSYFINCKDIYDEDSLTNKWDGVILVNDSGNFIGTAINDDGGRELIISN